MHRPPMDWEAAGRRHDPATVEGAPGPGLWHLVAARQASPAVHARDLAEPLWTGNDHVFRLVREHASERLLVLPSFSAD